MPEMALVVKRQHLPSRRWDHLVPEESIQRKQTVTLASGGRDGELRLLSAPVTHRLWIEGELRAANLQMQAFTNADHKLQSDYGDTVHQNDGTHLDGGIGPNTDQCAQHLYRRIIACCLPLWDLPEGLWTKRFLRALTYNSKLRKPT